MAVCGVIMGRTILPFRIAFETAKMLSNTTKDVTNLTER
jgi:hypothetical protein